MSAKRCVDQDVVGEQFVPLLFGPRFYEQVDVIRVFYSLGEFEGRGAIVSFGVGVGSVR